MKQIIIFILALPFIILLLLPSSIRSIQLFCWIAGCCYSILPILIYMKKSNERLLKPILDSFNGKFSILSQSITSHYNNHEFALSFKAGNGKHPIYLWDVKLCLKNSLNYDAYIYNCNPGPVFLKKRILSNPQGQNDLYSFSSNPDKAKYFVENEKNKNLIRDILSVSSTSRASECTSDNPIMKYLTRIGIPLIIKPNRIIATLRTNRKEAINPEFVRNTLKKMIALTENL